MSILERKLGLPCFKINFGKKWFFRNSWKSHGWFIFSSQIQQLRALPQEASPGSSPSHFQSLKDRRSAMLKNYTPPLRSQKRSPFISRAQLMEQPVLLSTSQRPARGYVRVFCSFPAGTGTVLSTTQETIPKLAPLDVQGRFQSPRSLHQVTHCCNWLPSHLRYLTRHT